MDTVIEALQKAYEQNNFEEQAKQFSTLGSRYLEKKDFANAVACYNFALAIAQDEKKNIQFKQTPDSYQTDLIEKIKAAEKQFLLTTTGKALTPCDYQLDLAHKKYLEGLRNEARAHLQRHQALTEMVNHQLPKDISPIERIKRIEERLKQEGLIIQQIYQQINEQLRGFVQLLIEECKQVLGEPPCRYAIICFGSLARDEATPYSDLEFGILIEDAAERYQQHGILYYSDKEGSYPFIKEAQALNEQHKEYFRNLTRLLHIKVINLGETTARMMDIEELGWLPESDSPTKKGFSFDGQMEDGCHTPLGNRHHTKTKIAAIQKNERLTAEEKEKAIQTVKAGKYELIGTPEELAQFQTDKWEQKHGICTVMSTVESIIINGQENTPPPSKAI